MSEAKSLKEICNQYDVRSMVEDGFRIRQHKEKHKVRKPKIARFKARFDFKDGNQFYMYSLDFHKGTAGIFCDEWLSCSNILFQWSEWKNETEKLTVWVNMLDDKPLSSQKRYDVIMLERSANYDWSNPFVIFPEFGQHKLIRWKNGGMEQYLAWERERKGKLAQRDQKRAVLMGDFTTNQVQ